MMAQNRGREEVPQVTLPVGRPAHAVSLLGMDRAES